MPLAPALALRLCDRGHDAVHAAAVGLDRAHDLEILARAKQEARTIITTDLDYPRLLALAEASEPSIILFRDGDWSEADVIARVTHLLTALRETEITQSIIVIERQRIRRRRLPLKS